MYPLHFFCFFTQFLSLSFFTNPLKKEPLFFKFYSKTMKGSSWFSLIFIAFLLFPTPIASRRISQQNSRHGHHHKAAAVTRKEKLYWLERKAAMGRRGAETVEVAGSSLPDCSHACGSCSPCRLVMISFVCASLQEAETCPMAYRCMCNNKSYPVP